MKISELILELAGVLSRDGDLPIYVYNDYKEEYAEGTVEVTVFENGTVRIDNYVE